MDAVPAVQGAYHMVLISYLQFSLLIELHSLVGAPPQTRQLFKTCQEELHNQSQQLFDLMDGHWRFASRTFGHQAQTLQLRARLFDHIDHVVSNYLLGRLRDLKAAVRPLHSEIATDVGNHVTDILVAIDEFYATIVRCTRLMSSVEPAFDA
jgi:hypothetical protein